MYQHWASTLVGMSKLAILVIVNKNKIGIRFDFLNRFKIKIEFFWEKCT
jgi:hypothetical protein